jgi:glycosyltransferase involved in cell wall biosynthesis
MKVLLNHASPFLLAHGGLQIQIEQTRAALERAGVEVEYLRWWDAGQRGDLIHFFGIPAAANPDLVRQKGIKLVVTQLLCGLGARAAWKRWVQKAVVHTAQRTLPAGLLARTGWNAWRTADAYVAITPWEAKLMHEIFQAPAERVHVVPNGVAGFFFEQPPETRGPWLVTTASILPVKRLIETAEAAVAAQTPYWIIGRPFSEADAYFQNFSALCRRHPKILRHDDVMRTQPELAQVYRQARGFVLLSRWETQSLSALEAAACECPLLLGDLPWARSTFGDAVNYCPVTNSTPAVAKILREFYDAAPNLPVPPRPQTWGEIGRQLKAVYERVLSTSR